MLVVGMWPSRASAGMLCGEEERGWMDILLSVPGARLRVAVEKVAALWTGLVAMGLVVGLLTYASGLAVKGDIGLGSSIAFGLTLPFMFGVFAGIGLLVSQFPHHRPTPPSTPTLLPLILILTHPLPPLPPAP